MLTYVRVRNLAIVEEIAIEPGPGLNVLTGETGAGKSLLIDSLQFLSGARGSTDLIRTGTDKMSAEAAFQLPEAVMDRLRDSAIEFEERELIVKRELSGNGRGRVLLNGSVTSVRELTAAMDQILEIHGQDQSHDRVAGATFREVLDFFAGNESQLVQTREAYGEWRRGAAELAEMTHAEKDRLVRLDLLKYQVEEITAARLELGEEEALRAEKAILANARQIGTAAAGAFSALSEDDDAALSQLTRAIQLLQPLARSVQEIEELQAELQQIRIRLEESVRLLSRFGSNVRDDPKRLDEVEERLALIDRMKRKYGGTIEEILASLANSSREYERLQDYESTIASLEKRELEFRRRYQGAAEELSRRRSETAPALQHAIQSELGHLAMDRTRVVVQVLSPQGTERSGNAEGFDRVEFLIAPNAGEELRPMNRIASGGELSRIQLAIAAALFSRLERTSESVTLVFDEVDAGIGGRVAEVVGRKLRELASQNQVICVTHLPQIASFASTHFRVWKEEAAGRTRARIERLDDREQRVREIARMLGGEKVSASAIAHARELLDQSAASQGRRKRASAAAV